ncbi:uncharacterized protein LOC116199272 isoform X2 [Punica granatum]|uniref:Uncharacterized protein LOC116199272 isoform X2 n=1 Tax=Punica granatum TaxID=22663 RepID=A0A6P8CTE5_PUNGR|nr:uncharacterized protein LOC116199272 isoform X2 [Punica granatum]
MMKAGGSNRRRLNRLEFDSTVKLRGYLQRQYVNPRMLGAVQVTGPKSRVHGSLNRETHHQLQLYISLVEYSWEQHRSLLIDYFLSGLQKNEVQFKFDRCYRFLQETVHDLPTFGMGHSLGSVIHLLIGSRYAVQRNGNVLMAFNNKEASLAIPLFSPVLVPMAQSLGPFLSQIVSSPTVRLGAEMTMKQLESLSPPIMKQVLPLVEQLPPLYMDLVKGREDFSPKPEETRRLVKSYYGISRNLLIKFKDDTIDETSTLAQVLSSEAAISSMLDMSIRTLPGDHGLPLLQALPDVPPAMADAVNRGSEFIASLTVGTPWESVAKEMGSSFGVDSRSRVIQANSSKDINLLVDVITSWMSSNMGPKLLRS